MTRINKRKSYRAPLNTFLLYVDHDFVYKARLMNISSTGLALRTLPHFPEKEKVYGMMDIPYLPCFNKLSLKELETLLFNGYERSIQRIQLKMKRRLSETTSVDDIFKQGIGCEILNTSGEYINLVNEYVENYKKNLIMLIQFFEESHIEESQVKVFKTSLQLLGYSIGKKMHVLRNEVEKDYLGFEY